MAWTMLVWGEGVEGGKERAPLRGYWGCAPAGGEQAEGAELDARQAFGPLSLPAPAGASCLLAGIQSSGVPPLPLPLLYPQAVL